MFLVSSFVLDPAQLLLILILFAKRVVFIFRDMRMTKALCQGGEGQ